MQVVQLDQSQQALSPEIQQSLVLAGDLSRLTDAQKQEYYVYRCRQVGLDPAAKPFDLLKLNGKLILYANAGCTQQLCAMHKLSTQITHRERIDGIYIVSVRVTGQDGRVSENQGAVDVSTARGDVLANAILKATTKAIRRAVLAHIGLGMLDETEVEAIPEARPVKIDLEPPTPTSVEVVYDLMVPRLSSPYKSVTSLDSWVQEFSAMATRIAKSQKLSDKERESNLLELWDKNSQMIALLDMEKPALRSVVERDYDAAVALVTKDMEDAQVKK
jgi:hypothetical protein